MKAILQFLRETWELWYWAMFRPSLLQQRMNAWAPCEEQDGHKPDTSYTDILLSFTTFNLRFFWQFIVLALLLSLPLSAAVIDGGQALDWLLIIAALLSAYGIAIWFLPLGLHLPLLFAIAYVEQPTVLRQTLRASLEVLPPWSQLVTGASVGIILSVSISLAGRWFWRKKRIKLGWMILFTGLLLSSISGIWIATQNSLPIVFSVLMIGMLFALTLKARVFTPGDDPEQVFVVSTMVMNLITGTVAATFMFAISEKILDEETHVSGIMAFVIAFAMVNTIMYNQIFGDFSNSYGVTFGLTAGFALVVAFTIASSVMLPFVSIDLLPLYALSFMAWLIGFAYSATISRWWWGFILASLMMLPIGQQFGWWALIVGAACLIGYFRLFPFYMSYLHTDPKKEISDSPTDIALWKMYHLPPCVDEILWIPLPKHSRILVDAFRVDSEAAMNILDQMRTSRYPGFRQTVQQAIPLMVLEQLHRVKSVADIATTTSPTHLILPYLLPAFSHTDEEPHDETLAPLMFTGRMDATTLEVLYRLRDIACGISANLNASNASIRQRGLERSLDKLANLKVQLPTLRLPKHNQTMALEVLTQWQTVIEQEIGQQHATAEEQVINPFQSGNPLRADRADLFKGRQQFADDIARQVLDRSRPTLVLHGPRRCGKSSFLLNLPRILPIRDILPVYIDLQSAASTGSEADFCYGLVRAMTRDLRSQEIAAPPTQRSAFRDNAYAALEDWLDQVVHLLGERRVLLCLDEFEKLGNAIYEGKIPPTIFDELRHLIQHHDELGFLFCGVQTLDEIGPNWSSYFISVRPIEMTYLEPNEARDLLTNPDPEFNLRYADGIVERVMHETRCQPYLLQLMGEAMVTQANQHYTQVVTDDLLDAAFAAALRTGEPYFTNLWTEYTGTTPDEVRAGQAFLHRVAHGQPVPSLDGRALAAALHRLTRYHVVEQVDSGYRCEVPLVARWVRERAVVEQPEEQP